jgi:LuxR family transcriptional regulator, maltose regulon positive regulatory protein
MAHLIAVGPQIEPCDCRPLMADPRERSKPKAIPAKISPPRLTETYRRGRLFRAIDVARRRRALWVAAPAGAGKTSVVTSYLSARRLPALWYNVDARDVDVANLFHYLSTAARVATPRRALKIPAFQPENQAGIAAFARGFFEALSRARPVPSVIVLDDYHEAKSALWDEVIRDALCGLPDGLCAMIMSRSEPPPVFARLIASGEIRILGPDDLRLTEREMAGLVHLYRPDLRAKQAKAGVKRVCALADGWAAALTLLLQEPDIGALSRHGLEQGPERLFDYFATEILDKVTPRERDFLLKTSIVPSFTATLAEHLTGVTDTARILVDLERRSSLTQRLGSSGAHRHHPLLREFLMRQAERELGREELGKLHRLAAESLTESGLIDEAMEQLEKARDVVLRAQIILRVAPSYVASGRGRTIEMWIAGLPPECVEPDGWLSYWAAISCVDHSPSRARELLERAYAHFANTRDIAGLYRCCAAAIQAIVHEGTDFSRLDPWVERLDRMRLERSACPQPLLPMVATGMLVACIFRRRDPAQGRYWAEQASKLATESDDVAHRLMTGGFLAFYFTLHEDAAHGSAILEMLRATARAAQMSPLSVLTLLLADAMCSWVRGDNAACISLAREALALAGRAGIFVWNIYLQTLGIAATLASDHAANVQEFLDQVAQAALAGPPLVAVGFHFNTSWDALVRGESIRALHGGELACKSADQVGYPLAQSCANLALANALFLSRRRPDALAALRRARRHAEDIASAYLLQGCDLMEADFLWEDDREHALVLLKRGLSLARARGYHTLFCMTKSLMARTAERALEHEIEPEHVRQTIVKHGLAPQCRSARLESWPWRYRVRSLGSFEISRGEGVSLATEPARHGGRSGQESGPRGMPLRLLQAVVAFGGRDVRETVLIDALWPEADGDAGRRVFDTTLHRLRRQLGDDDVLYLNHGRVGLEEQLCWLDTWAVEEILAETAREVPRGASVAELLALSRRLVGIYRGPLLADEATASWARAPRERLAAKFVRAADHLGLALEQQGEFDEAAALYRRILDGDALAERAYVGLMRCAIGSGHRTDAMLLYERYREHLAATMHTRPSEQMRNLYAKLSAEGSPGDG